MESESMLGIIILLISIVDSFQQQTITDNSFIVNGQLVSDGDARHQIALFKSGSFVCGGSLISWKTVLTAAHCVYGSERNPSQFTVYYGSLDRNSKQGQTVGVVRIVIHPAFTRRTLNYDLAVLQLIEPVVAGNQTEIIELTNQTPGAGSEITVTGWGKIGANEPTSNRLMKANLQIRDQDSCGKQWAGEQPITEAMLCAFSSTQSCCNGDSGGPATQNHRLIGVVSFGSQTCTDTTRLSNVFVNIGNEQIRKWITVNIIT